MTLEESAVGGVPSSVLGPAAGRRPRRIAGAASSLLRPITALWIVLVAILVLPIVVFLSIAISPALLGQGTSWFDLRAFGRALSGTTLQGFADSVVVALIAAAVAGVIGFWLAWMLLRTNAVLRRLTTGLIFALFLTPSYLIALGWQRLIEVNGVLEILGGHPDAFRTLFYGPFGVTVVLIVKGIPFAYLAIANALRGLGREHEEAVRIHGGSGFAGIRMSLQLLAPAVWSAVAIVFAESVSDFGVASTLANTAHFPVATYTLYTAVQAFPADFPLASAVSWLLMALVVVALILQNRAIRGRSYRVLSGRTRPSRITELGIGAQALWLVGFIALVLTTLGIPVLGAVSASLIDGLGTLNGSHEWTFANYLRVLQSPKLGGPLVYSIGLAAITATICLFLAVACARILAIRGTSIGARILDAVLIGAVALPGIVFAAGYIFTYNLPQLNAVGLKIYGTTTLLVLAYLATALPSMSRLLVGSMSQLHDSMQHASRAHGAGGIRTWLAVTLPVISRPLLSAWLLTYSATLLELPVSQLLSPPGSQPVAIGIQYALNAYDFGGGTAMEVLAILSALAVVAIGYGGYRLLAPAGWRRLGGTR